MAMDNLPILSYRRDIDGLRAIAVLSVVGYHAFPNAAPGGFVGVDIFFVISGYLISGVILSGLYRGGFRFRKFYARRIKRIFPALLLVLAACLAFGWFTLLPSEYEQLGKHVAAGAGFVSNFVLWHESGYFDKAAQLKPLLHLWSLGIEEQFYLVWPLLLYVAWKLRLSLLTVIPPIVLASFLLNLYTYQHDAVAAFYSPLTRFWELSIGSTLACITLSKPNIFDSLLGRFTNFINSIPLLLRLNLLSNLSALAGILLIVVSVVGVPTFPAWWAALATAGTFLLISSGPDAWLSRKVLSNPAMVFIGLISYPLYLWHWPFLSFARIIGYDTATDYRVVVSVVLISFFLAWLTYRLVERPIRFRVRSFRTVPCLASAMLIIGGVGFSTFEHKGSDSGRVPALASAFIQKYAKSNYELSIAKYGSFNYDFTADARLGSCWVGGLDAGDKYSDRCTDNSGPARLLFVWGDSHAARLYPGLRKAAGREFRLAQYTRDACPPILDFGYPNCLSGNSFVFNKIREVNPDVVVLFAAWNRYWPSWTGRDELLLKRLDATVSEIRKVSTSKLLIVGPAPQWKDSLQRTLMRFASQDYPLHRVPRRTFFGVEPAVRQADRAFENLFGMRMDVTYVSAWKAFCDEDGCLTRLDEEAGGLTTFDNGHLTTRSAEYFARTLPMMRAGVTR
jgi:peptidoglycan/LPS O-acetylase OafA/YrhL